MKKWVALFSNSGKELAEVIDKIGTKPDLILCDQVRTDWDERLDSVQISGPSAIQELLETLNEDVLITMHGYWKLLKASKIKAKIYNVHPGDIFKYPELKGIHPQKKAIELGLKSTGVLIHEVDDTVDGGTPQFFADYIIPEGMNEAELTEELRHEAVKLWQIFFIGKL